RYGPSSALPACPPPAWSRVELRPLRLSMRANLLQRQSPLKVPIPNRPRLDVLPHPCPPHVADPVHAPQRTVHPPGHDVVALGPHRRHCLFDLPVTAGIVKLAFQLPAQLTALAFYSGGAAHVITLPIGRRNGQQPPPTPRKARCSPRHVDPCLACRGTV